MQGTGLHLKQLRVWCLAQGYLDGTGITNTVISGRPNAEPNKKYKSLFCSFCLFPNTRVDILFINLVFKATTFCSLQGHRVHRKSCERADLRCTINLCSRHTVVNPQASVLQAKLISTCASSLLCD